jgi:hypothetical protein
MPGETWPNEPPDYEQCPVCERVFVVEDLRLRSKGHSLDPTELERHIREDHHMVKLRKGSNYKWVDAAEMARLVKEGLTLSKRPK